MQVNVNKVIPPGSFLTQALVTCALCFEGLDFEGMILVK